ncbi:MAG: putative glycoside hydrolase [Patescibacteria group bacterium]
MPILATSLLVLAGVFATITFFPPAVFDVHYKRLPPDASDTTIVSSVSREISENTPEDTRPIVRHIPLPEQVKGIYMTSCVAGTPSFREQLVRLAQETEINSIIIDIKDYSGTISFPPTAEPLKPAWQNARCGTKDMRQLVEMLHDNGIFVIGRITVFQDPFYAPQHPELAVLRGDGIQVWRDFKGLTFIDVAAKPYWDYILALSVDTYNLGFDELNYDYVRYPSDGNMADTFYPQSIASEYGMDRQANLEAFFKYLNAQLDDESRFLSYRHENTGRASSTPWTSVDLFGMTTTNFDDLSIGQVQDRAAPYFDFIAPMVYPSHYPNSFLGLGNPNDHPYQVVYHAMKVGVERMEAPVTPMRGFAHERLGTSTPASYRKPAYGPEKFRTWIQDFDYGGDYDAADVRAEIQASYDAGVMSWMIWAPSNIYTRAALETAEAVQE